MLERIKALFSTSEASEPLARSLASGDIVIEGENGTKVINHKKTAEHDKPKTSHRCRKESLEARRRRLRKDARWLLEESEHVKSIARDLQTYVQPIGYEAKTDDPEKNRRIDAFILEWADKCDFFRQHTFWEMLGLAEIGKTFDGYHGLAVVQLEEPSKEANGASADSDHDSDEEDRTFLQLQAFDPTQIGCPSATSSIKDAEYYPPDFPEKKQNALYYYEGIEFDKHGRPIKVHTWTRKAKDPNKVTDTPTITKAGESRKDADMEWAYDQAYTWKQFLLFSDPLKTNDILPSTDFEQAIEKLLVAIGILTGVCDKADFASRILGTYEGGDGHIEANDLNSGGASTCGCGKPECQACNPPSIEIEGGRKILGIPDGKKFKPSEFKVDPETFRMTMEMLVSSSAVSVHLPPSFTGINMGRLQGTDLRIKLESATAEMNRRRDLQRPRALRIVRAAILHGKEKGDKRLTDIEVADIMDGNFLYRRDPSADIQRQGKEFRADVKAGFRCESDVQAMYGRSSEQVNQKRKREITRLLQDIQEVRKKYGEEFSLSFVASLFREQASGVVQEAVEPNDEQDDDESTQQADETLPFPAAQ